MIFALDCTPQRGELRQSNFAIDCTSALRLCSFMLRSGLLAKTFQFFSLVVLIKPTREPSSKPSSKLDSNSRGGIPSRCPDRAGSRTLALKQSTLSILASEAVRLIARFP